MTKPPDVSQPVAWRYRTIPHPQSKARGRYEGVWSVTLDKQGVENAEQYGFEVEPLYSQAALDAAHARGQADSTAERDELVAVAEMVDVWGHGLRHETAHESKMVKAARATLTRIKASS